MPWQRLSWILALARRRRQSVEELGRYLKAGQRYKLPKACYSHTPRSGETFEPQQAYRILPLTSTKKRRTEITIEIDEVRLISRGLDASAAGWCSGCEAIVTLVAPESAAAIAGVAVRTINQWVEAESVHFVETDAGLLLVCVNSLKSRPF